MLKKLYQSIKIWIKLQLGIKIENELPADPPDLG